MLNKLCVFFLLVLCFVCLAQQQKKINSIDTSKVKQFKTLQSFKQFAKKEETVVAQVFVSPAAKNSQLLDQALAILQTNVNDKVKVAKVDLRDFIKLKSTKQDSNDSSEDSSPSSAAELDPEDVYDFSRNKFLKEYKSTFEELPEITVEVPQMVVFRYGICKPYYGPRDFKGLQQYFKTFRTIGQLHSKDNAEDFLDKNGMSTVVLAYPGSNASHQKSIKNIVEHAAHVLCDSVKFALVYDEKVAKSMGMSAKRNYVLIKPLEEPVFLAGADISSFEKLVDAVEKNKQEQHLMGIRSENIAQILNRYNQIIIGFVDSVESLTSRKFLNSLKEISMEYARREEEEAAEQEKQNDKKKKRNKKKAEKKIVFTFSQISGMEGYLSQQFGVQQDLVSAPMLVLMEPKKSKYFVFDKGTNDILNKEHIENWLNEFQQGKLKQFRKSEKLPLLLDQESSLKQVSFDNLDHFIQHNKESNHILFVKFYQPNCPHCKQIEPVIQQLADSETTVIIGKMDVSKNNLPDIVAPHVQGVPALILFCTHKDGSKNASEGIHYEVFKGTERSLSKFQEFINTHKENCSNQARTKSAKDEL